MDHINDEEWGRMVAHAWINPEFKSLLESDPAAAARKFGIEKPVVFQVPPRPAGFDDDQVQRIANGDESHNVRMSC